MEEKLKIDYDRTSQYFFHLSDVRFKLLGLLPIAAGGAVALLPQHLSPASSLATGILGLVTTSALLLYDQRNSQIYNSLIGRANILEESMRFPPLRPSLKRVGGAFIDRPGDAHVRNIFGVVPNHGLALDLIYSASVGGWLYVVSEALIRLSTGDPSDAGLAAVLISATLAAILYFRLRAVDKSAKEGQIPKEIADRIDQPKVGTSSADAASTIAPR